MGLNNGFLWPCMIVVSLIDFSGALTTLFFARLSPLSDTKILLWYLTVLGIMFRFMLLGSMCMLSLML